MLRASVPNHTKITKREHIRRLLQIVWGASHSRNMTIMEAHQRAELVSFCAMVCATPVKFQEPLCYRFSYGIRAGRPAVSGAYFDRGMGLGTSPGRDSETFYAIYGSLPRYSTVAMRFNRCLGQRKFAAKANTRHRDHPRTAGS